MMRHVIGAGATMLILVAALSYPDGAAAHGGADMEQDPCLARLVKVRCISVPISRNTN